jgi:hypothetical protein
VNGDQYSLIEWNPTDMTDQRWPNVLELQFVDAERR